MHQPKDPAWIAPIKTPHEEEAERFCECTGPLDDSDDRERARSAVAAENRSASRMGIEQRNGRVSFPPPAVAEAATALGRSPTEPGTRRLAAALKPDWRLDCTLTQHIDGWYSVEAPNGLILSARTSNHWYSGTAFGAFATTEDAFAALARARHYSDPGTPSTRRVTAADLSPYLPEIGRDLEAEALDRDKAEARAAEPPTEAQAVAEAMRRIN